MKFEGEVKVLNSKTVQGRRGPTSVWSMKVEKPDGAESPWFTVKFGAKPDFDKGDYVRFTATENDRGYWNVDDQGKAIEKVERPRAAAAAVSGGASGEGTADRQQSIVLQHSQEMAVRTVDTLLREKALPVTGAQTKAGEAKRYQEIVLAVRKLTVLFYFDAITARLLDNVEDEGVIDTAPDGALPETADAGAPDGY